MGATRQKSNAAAATMAAQELLESGRRASMKNLYMRIVQGAAVRGAGGIEDVTAS